MNNKYMRQDEDSVDGVTRNGRTNRGVASSTCIRWEYE